MRFDEVVTTIREALPDARLVYLFGSRASGNSIAESDTDLAVLAHDPIDPMPRWRLQEDLANRLRCDVDLVDLRRASTELIRS